MLWGHQRNKATGVEQAKQSGIKNPNEIIFVCGKLAVFNEENERT